MVFRKYLEAVNDYLQHYSAWLPSNTDGSLVLVL